LSYDSLRLSSCSSDLYSKLRRQVLPS